MPRVVQTIDAKDNVPGGEYTNSDEETEDSDKQLINSNTSDLKTNQAEYIDDIHQKTTCQSSVNSSQNSIAFNPLDEDDDNDENSPLRVIIGGQVKKFKKDSRVWLHKSSAKIRKRDGSCAPDECGIISPEERGDNQSVLKRCRSDVMEVGTENDSGQKYLPMKNVNITESTVSLLGDSDADLSYSEEDTTQQSHASAPCLRSLSFYKQDQGYCEDPDRETESMDWEDEIPGETQIAAEGGLKGTECCCKTASEKQFVTTSDEELSLKRIAPAIALEDESLKESLLDFAVNHFGKQQRVLSGRVYKRSKGKRKFHPLRRKDGINSPPRLPTCVCPYQILTRQRRADLEGSEDCLLHFNRCLARISSVNSRKRDSHGQTISGDTTQTVSPKQVPSLLLMAASALNIGTMGNNEKDRTEANNNNQQF